MVPPYPWSRYLWIPPSANPETTDCVWAVPRFMTPSPLTLVHPVEAFGEVLEGEEGCYSPVLTCFQQVKATDRDSGLFGHIEYFLYDGFHNYEKSKAFQINSSSGHICVAQDIDSEEDPSTYDLLVKATDGQQFYYQNIRKETSMEKPSIDACSTEVLNENHEARTSRVGPVVVKALKRLVTPCDKLVSYRGLKIAFLVPAEGRNGKDIALVEGGLSAQAFVRIEIEDINDNHPIFNPATYMTSISSHMQPGTEIISVVATDKDSGIYGVVTYELVPGDFSSLFTVDTSTGIFTLQNYQYMLNPPKRNVKLQSEASSVEKPSMDIGAFQFGGLCVDVDKGSRLAGIVYLISTLSKVKQHNVVLTISARDGGGLCSVVNAVVTVRILQMAVAPAIFERSRYTFSIPEDISEGSAVGTVKVREPLNFLEPISYRISSGDPYGRFSVDPQYGIIRTRKELDHEIYNHIVLTVQSQLGNSPVHSSAQVNIAIIDVNDNPPVFAVESDQINISRSTVPGTALYIARAEDKDSGLNGAIQYTILSNESGVFSIDPALGVLYLARTLAADKQNKYILHITAEDRGSPPLSSVLILTVAVEDQKGVPALAFENLVYQVEVSERTSIGARILQIQTRTLDPQHTPGEVAYSLEHNTDSASFRICPETGVIYLQNPLDYEHMQSHSFRAFVSSLMDKSGQNTSTSVIVNVMDENDNSPVFVHEAYFFEIEESPLPQGVVGTIAAVDKDSGRNGQLSYFLLSDGKYFKINSNTGEIINWVALDHEQQAHHQLTVLVTDHGVPQHNATVTSYISVTDINDNHPSFPQLPPGVELRVKVLEGQPAGTLVASVFAKDLDSGNSGIVLYSLSSGESLDLFQINSTSGELRTTETLLYSWQSSYRLVVTATDQGIPSLQGQTVIIVEVIPLLKRRSLSSQNIRHFGVPENFRPAQIIGSLRLPSQQSYSNKKLHFSISEEDSDVPFEVDSATGDLFLIKELDYETASHYFFTVVLNSSSQNNTVFVTVDVEDQNDHSPSFQNDFVVIGIEENVPIGTLVYTFDARDEDGSSLNSNLEYSIHRTDLAANPFLIHSSYGNLITVLPLDREMTQSVVLRVLVSDQAVNITDRRQDSLTAKIVILDVNDNHPSFVSSPLSYIREDAEVGSLVHCVIAEDPDQGRNGQITYHLLSGNEDYAFVLDKTTGLLTTTYALDHERQEYYNLTVVAFDNGIPALSATQILTILVLDVNDEKPVFTKALYETSICENNDPEEVVIKIEAMDKDSGTNSLLRYEILPGPGYEMFQINSVTGEITTAASLDRETQEIFTIKVLVRDSGSPILSSTTSVVFRILDENDYAPKFIVPVTEIQILENQEPSAISTLLAVDQDAASNGTMHYHIIGGNDRGYFALHKTSGELFTTCTLDRETARNFTLLIESSDLGNLTRSSVTQLQITVLDENDNSPLFARNHYETTVREDLREGSAVLELFAVDADEGPNGEVTYWLIDSTLGAFTINNVTGTVSTTKPLDRERKSQYVFRVMATDSGILGPRSSSVTVIIHIEDVNDNTPFFLQNPVKAYVSSQTPVNQTIATVRASDLDLGRNGAVSFSLATPEAMFQMNPSTGEVFLREQIPHKDFNTHFLIIASDQGIPARTATALLAIYSEANMEMISFSHKQYETALPENSGIGTSVFTVAAYDRSLLGANLKHTIFNEHEDSFLFLSNKTGEITVKQSQFLDYEVRKRVHFAILAENGLNSALCEMTVLIQDMNDNAPQFEQSYYKTLVWEGQVSNTYVMQIYATDLDSGLNGEIEYLILSGNINDTFLIDSTQGIISTNTILDREGISSYRLIVQAVDKGTPQLSATSIVEIQVVDINDNAPTLQPLGVVKLPENAPPGFLVLQVLADDMDLGPPLHYSFAEDGNSRMKFAIDQYKGIITLVQALDFEEIGQLKLLISVSDSVHETTEELLILILDENDNPPVFTQDAYQVMIPELMPIDVSILTVHATDRDSQYNGNISYRIIFPSDVFSIDSQNGSVFLAKAVTYEDKNPVVQLLIEACDNGSPPLTALTSVLVQIQDVNKDAPQFTTPLYNVSVSENASVGEKLLTFSVIDRDRTPENTKVEYSIIGGNGSNKFHVEISVIGPDSVNKLVGNLVLGSILDREKSSTYQLLILASDYGTPPLNSTATVSIVVLDVNDNPPIFTSLEYHVHIRENIPVGSHITAVSASDCDSGSNAEVTYIITSGNDKGHFRLDARTGSIDLVKALDYEETMKFSLTVQASDGGVDVKNEAFAIVFVNILDANDYTPIFVFPNLDCEVGENLPPLSSVCTISALDFDTGPFGHLSYSIMSSCLPNHGTSRDHDMFFIDPLTGDIRTKHVLDFERQMKFCFVAQASDKSDSIATVTIQVTVEGVDEFDPVFNQDQYFFDFPEKNEAGQLVGKVTASDYDRGLDGIVHYTLLKQSPFFSVNHSSGAIYLTRSFHRKRDSMKRTDGILELIVKAHSPKLDSKFSTCTIWVNISNTPEAYSMLPVHTVSVSIATSTVMFLLLAVTLAVLIVRYRQKDAANSRMKKEVPCSSATDLNNEKTTPKATQKTQVLATGSLPIGAIAEWVSIVGIREKKNIDNCCRHSDSSGHGSAEGETAEDEEIQRINEHPCRKGSGSALSDGGSRIPDSGIPRESDQLSCQSGETDMVAVSQSIGPVHCFKDGGRSDCDTTYTCNKMLLQALQDMRIKEKDIVADITREHVFIPDGQNSHYGSLATLVDCDEDLRDSGNWDYLLNWEPRFKPLASVFNEIAELKDESLKTYSFPKEKKYFIFPPPLITSIAQPGLKTVPPRLPSLLPAQAMKKYPRSPLTHHLRHPPSAMTPSFSPSLSLLTVQTPTASPVASHPSRKGMCPGGPTCELSAEEEVQV
ncbi:protocadherin-23 [Tiliqua scincoides]|uniref:protocadherin-23 n=1 Tax=Tiliqua scincoides TaxID=71010 RepID=UPI003462B5A5